MTKSAKKRSDRKAVDTDLIVGANVRRMRTEAGLTLADLADALGISHQQLQKYETGANRISAGMLYELARFFAISVDRLFDGGEAPPGEDNDLYRARRKCHIVIDRTGSAATLDAMSKVLRAMSAD